MSQANTIIKPDLISGLSFYERWNINNNNFFIFGEHHTHGPQSGCKNCNCQTLNEECCRTFFDYLDIFETLENYNLFIEYQYIYHPKKSQKKLEFKKTEQPKFISFVSTPSNLKIFNEKYLSCYHKLPDCALKNTKVHYTDLRFDIKFDEKFLTLESKIFKFINDNIAKSIVPLYNKYIEDTKNDIELAFYSTLNHYGNFFLKEKFLDDYKNFINNPIDAFLLLTEKNYIDKKMSLKDKSIINLKPLLYTQLSKNEIKLNNKVLKNIFEILLKEREKDLKFQHSFLPAFNINEVKTYIINFIDLSLQVAKHENYREMEMIEYKRKTTEDNEYEKTDEILDFIKQIEEFDKNDDIINKNVSTFLDVFYKKDYSKVIKFKNSILNNQVKINVPYKNEEELEDIVKNMILSPIILNKITFIAELSFFLEIFYGSLLMDAYIIFRSLKYNENIAVLTGSAHSKYISNVLKYLTKDNIVQGKLLEKSIHSNFCDKVISVH